MLGQFESDVVSRRVPDRSERTTPREDSIEVETDTRLMAPIAPPNPKQPPFGGLESSESPLSQKR